MFKDSKKKMLFLFIEDAQYKHVKNVNAFRNFARKAFEIF
jgi:hypothetical protein